MWTKHCGSVRKGMRLFSLSGGRFLVCLSHSRSLEAQWEASRCLPARDVYYLQCMNYLTDSQSAIRRFVRIRKEIQRI